MTFSSICYKILLIIINTYIAWYFVAHALRKIVLFVEKIRFVTAFPVDLPPPPKKKYLYPCNTWRAFCSASGMMRGPPSSGLWPTRRLAFDPLQVFVYCMSKKSCPIFNVHYT